MRLRSLNKTRLASQAKRKGKAGRHFVLWWINLKSVGNEETSEKEIRQKFIRVKRRAFKVDNGFMMQGKFTRLAWICTQTLMHYWSRKNWCPKTLRVDRVWEIICILSRRTREREIENGGKMKNLHEGTT